ncbi:hypothetical protein SK128_000504, partial [Halocaridina rubra]
VTPSPKFFKTVKALHDNWQMELAIMMPFSKFKHYSGPMSFQLPAMPSVSEMKWLCRVLRTV